ncbi:sugar-binding transcriptional regulator [Aureimonas glaciei]|uniref:sugar-binding transcriptional regulator n=1 Tax=Aureimonas glaciei TaxID=1776957 RepID=UPI00166ADA3A
MPSGGRERRVRTASQQDLDDSLAIRAAWLHYGAGMTQAKIATILGVTGVKAHRLIARANRSGAVKVTIEGDIAECVMLASRLSERFGLETCEVAPDLYESGLPLRALGIAGAQFIQAQIERLQGGVIGIGHGRTLAAAITALPRREAGDVRFVSLLGGVTRNYAANPHDVVHRLAEKTGVTAYVMPVPFFANSAGDREVLLAQRGVSTVFELGARSDLMIVGVGTGGPEAQLVASQMVDAGEMREVSELGGIGELLGHFFDSEGRPVITPLAARTVSPSLDALTGRKVVAIAGGHEKIAAIRAVLMSRCLDGLITDERTARALAHDDPA